MYLLGELTGMKVFDGAGVDIGLVDGLNFVYPEYRVLDVYFRVVGEKMSEIRNRRLEFIPLGEVDLIDENVRLYKDIDSLNPVIKNIDLEYVHMVFRARELVGEDVISFDGINLGEIVDVGIGKRDRKPSLIVKGPRISAIRGRDTEAIPFEEVIEIGDEVHINLQYDMLAKSVKER
ncbi:MAG: hypothetical protein GF416_02220 [Candidatus Altiarchaeales archaeon]|nr:hypothetical protein [Candidatus Altiarchaeales archaeon]MBD3415934.1 hypothetical protein [Candidatus Altiarchaeales archaeon]